MVLREEVGAGRGSCDTKRRPQVGLGGGRGNRNDHGNGYPNCTPGDRENATVVEAAYSLV